MKSLKQRLKNASAGVARLALTTALFKKRQQSKKRQASKKCQASKERQNALFNLQLERATLLLHYWYDKTTCQSSSVRLACASLASRHRRGGTYALMLSRSARRTYVRLPRTFSLMVPTEVPTRSARVP